MLDKQTNLGDRCCKCGRILRPEGEIIDQKTEVSNRHLVIVSTGLYTSGYSCGDCAGISDKEFDKFLKESLHS
jgi:hypothetical protein